MIVKKVNAFTDSINGGNPAGVVLKPLKLTINQMKQITRKLKVSETAFVFPSNVADYRLKFFSPDIEVDLCGHATIATFYTMAEEEMFHLHKKIVSITQETKAGVLPINIFFKDSKCEKVMMTQAKPIIKNIDIKTEEIANALNIKKNEIDMSLPQQITSTGLFTLPVCVKSFISLKGMMPNIESIKKLCTKYGSGSLHVYTFETLEEKSLYHARNFAPCYGIEEDPVTGTANGAVSYYLLKNGIINKNKIICEQGDIISRPGRVYVEIKNDVVCVGGRAKLVKEIQM